MPNNFRDHVDVWLKLSESETDYAVMFVKCWIPFNAWYCNNYGSTKDKTCLDQVKTDSNVFKAKLNSLLQGSNNESMRFQAHVAQLHEYLDENPIPDASENRITFKSIQFRDNPLRITTPRKNLRNLEYFSEYLTTGAVRCVIDDPRNTNPPLFNYSHSKWSLSHFEVDSDLLNLSDERKNLITQCFMEIDPRKKENMIRTKRGNSIKLGEFYFTNQIDLVSMAIIQILYLLRCKLFHGELQPNGNNLKAYEPAYHIMRILNKSLK